MRDNNIEVNILIMLLVEHERIQLNYSNGAMETAFVVYYSLAVFLSQLGPQSCCIIY